MSEFTDSLGKVWRICIDDDTQYRMALSGHDFTKMQEAFNAADGVDPIIALGYIWPFVARQAAADDVTPREFTERMADKAILDAYEAILNHAIDRSGLLAEPTPSGETIA